MKEDSGYAKVGRTKVGKVRRRIDWERMDGWMDG